ncbi:MAG: hypothetical protein L3J83_07420 [Proteobacteria bacterium]|nr:hypothetical protein [Pseudomonadota bacterium]
MNNLSMYSENGSLNVHLESLKIPVVDDELTGISYQCRGSGSVYPIHTCSSGRVTFQYNNTNYELRIKGWINLQSNDWDFEITNTDGKLHFYFDSTNKNKLNIKIQKLDVSTLAGFMNQFVNLGENLPEGLLSADFEIEFSDLIQINSSYAIEQLSWESNTGEYVIDGSSHQGDIVMNQTPKGLVLSVTNHLTKGEGLLKDMYLIFDENPITTQSIIDFNGVFQPISSTIIIESTAAIEFKIVMEDWYDNNIHIQFKINDLEQFYQGFIASYFEILGINDLTVAGKSQGSIALNNDKIVAVNIDLMSMDMEMQSKKIHMQNINAQLNWENTGPMQASTISWDKMLLAGMPINQSEIGFSSVGQQLILSKNTELPIFDGSILIHELSMQELFKPQINIDFDGSVKPISIALITEKMGWPIMQGSISGKIPAMKKIGHSIRFDGSLELEVFGGKMQINQLSTERLFGIAPVIAADIQFQKLNLQQITSTFDFGEISGLIDGKAGQLRITNWKADRMDAYIHTVKSKGTKQTISQRAIDNISSIGGLQGALSRSFLRFFDYFNYKKIGIGCKLRNSICEMRGIESSNGSYKLVQGKGIPSINIIGFQQFIDWEVFLDRILNAGY